MPLHEVTMKLHIVLLFILASSIAVIYAQEQTHEESLPIVLDKDEILRDFQIKFNKTNLNWDDGLGNEAKSASCTDKPAPPKRKHLAKEPVEKMDPEIFKGLKSGKLKFIGCAFRVDCNPPGLLCFLNPTSSGSSASGSSSGSSSGPPTDVTTTVANFSSSTRLFSIGLFVILAVIYL